MQKAKALARDPRQQPVAGDVICDATGAVTVTVLALYADPDGGTSILIRDTGPLGEHVNTIIASAYLRWVFLARARVVSKQECAP